MTGPPPTNEALTTPAHWDACWSDVRPPLERVHALGAPLLNAILDIFDRFMRADGVLSVLEIGGAPGQYLAYVHKALGHAIHCLDYSAVGCAKTLENFQALGIPGEVHQRDLLAADLNLPRFDVVYSLGVIEHFADLTDVVARHAALVKPGGLLLLGCPNYAGINQWFLRRLAPRMLANHNLDTMDVRRWTAFERTLRLTRLFRAYLGGFEPEHLNRLEDPTWTNRLLRTSVQVLCKVRRCQAYLRIPRWLNSRHFSAYCTGVYRTPA